MISVIADRISEKMLHEGLILEEDRELYRYGFFLLISRGIFFVIAGIAGAFVGNLWDSIFFYILFSFLRGYAGGLHADREAVCLFSTTASLFLAAKIIFCLKCGNYVMFSCCLLIVSSLLVSFIAPVGYGQQTVEQIGNSLLPKNRKTIDTAHEFELFRPPCGRIFPIFIYQLSRHRYGGGIVDSWKDKRDLSQ